MKSLRVVVALLMGVATVSQSVQAFDSSCYLHPGGTIQTVTGHNCPSISPFLTVKAGYRCEACGDLGPLQYMPVTGYGACFLDAPVCPPHLLGVFYQTQTLNISIQNRRLAIVCLNNGQSYGTTYCDCPTCESSPIIISLNDGRIALTSAADGVLFDLDGDGSWNLSAWTSEGTDDAFLVLDRNGNGMVDDGTELFGDSTPQPIPDPDDRNGFEALAVFDDSLSGGNQDGMIDSQDTIFSSLQLWVDANHNGISEFEELRSLSEANIVSFDLNYRRSGRKDRHGNEFRFRSGVQMSNRSAVAWDVFLVQQY